MDSEVIGAFIAAGAAVGAAFIGSSVVRDLTRRRRLASRIGATQGLVEGTKGDAAHERLQAHIDSMARELVVLDEPYTRSEIRARFFGIVMDTLAAAMWGAWLLLSGLSLWLQVGLDGPIDEIGVWGGVLFYAIGRRVSPHSDREDRIGDALAILRGEPWTDDARKDIAKRVRRTGKHSPCRSVVDPWLAKTNPPDQPGSPSASEAHAEAGRRPGEP